MFQALTVTDVLTNGVATKGIQLILTESSDTRVRKLHMHRENQQWVEECELPPLFPPEIAADHEFL